MSQKSSEFFFSFGIMTLGVALLFFGSITFTAAPVGNFVDKLPRSKPRVFPGGDVQAALLPVSRPSVPLSKTKLTNQVPLTAKAVVIADNETGAVFFQKNIDTVRSLASVTKLISALVLDEMPINWEEPVAITVADDVLSSHHVKVGEEFTRDDLLNIGLIGSSNSAMNALVRASGLSTAEFASKMNAFAKKNNWQSLKFVEPTGLGKDNVGNGRDLMRLLEVALQNERISQALGIPEYYASPLGANKRRRIWNTNWLLTKWIPSDYSVHNILGKTGFITESDYNFVSRITNNDGRAIRIILLGASSNEARFTETRALADWVFANYVWPDEEGYKELAE